MALQGIHLDAKCVCLSVGSRFLLSEEIKKSGHIATCVKRTLGDGAHGDVLWIRYVGEFVICEKCAFSSTGFIIAGWVSDIGWVPIMATLTIKSAGRASFGVTVVGKTLWARSAAIAVAQRTTGHFVNVRVELSIKIFMVGAG